MESEAGSEGVVEVLREGWVCASRPLIVMFWAAEARVRARKVAIRVETWVRTGSGSEASDERDCGWVVGAAGCGVAEVLAAPSSGMKVAGCAGAW